MFWITSPLRQWSDGTGITPPVVVVTPPAVGHVRVRGRAGRVLVRIEGGQVYEVFDEPEARKVVRSIKRKVERKLRNTAPTALATVEIPQIVVDGAAPFVESLRRDFDEVRVNWAAVIRRLEDEADEEDVEILLL